MINETPPRSDEEERTEPNNQREQNVIMPSSGSSRQSSGRKHVRKDRAKAYRMLTKVQNQSEIYRKKYKRLLEKISRKERKLTPHKKYKK